MKSKSVLRAMTLMISLLFSLVVVGQPKSKSQGAIPPGPCHQNTRVCVQNMNKQIGLLRAYVQHVKPGEKVIFNPQPDPPGIPASYRNAIQAYRALQAEFSDLGGWSTENPTEKRRAAISDAQEKFDRLGQASDRASIDLALTSLSSSVQRLSKTLSSR